MSTLIRWSPLREMAAMQGAMDRLFNDTWRTVWPVVQSNSSVAWDVYESESGYTIVADIPGVTQDHINITLNQNVLSLNVKIPQYTPQDGQKALLVERTAGQFSRSVTLPRPVNADQVEAVYENGVLTLTLPVSPEAQPKQIPIHTNGHMLQSNN